MEVTTADKKNAYDLLRLLLAVFVIITHAYLIGGYGLQDPLQTLSKGQTNFGEVGVMGFFALSGYLITASYSRTKNIFQFLGHRLLRIFPGYWICMLVVAFGLAPLIAGQPADASGGFPYSGPDGAVDYFFKNGLLVVKQWSIRGVLSHAAYKESLNGSLWSLYPELQCYIFVMVAGLFGMFHRNKMTYSLIAAAIIVYFAIAFNFKKDYGPTLLILSPALKLYASFVAGSLLEVYKNEFSPDSRGAVFVFLFALLLIKFGGFHLLSPLLIAISLIHLFRQFEFHLRYDLSFGLYIYSFPLQQLVYHYAGNRLPVLVFILISLALSAVFALLSYICIERPFMRLAKKSDLKLSGPFLDLFK